MPNVDKESEAKILGGQLTVPFPEVFVYSNVSAISTSMMDIRIGFAEAMPDGKAYPRVGVVIPPEHAVQLLLNIFQQLQVFERTFGQIRHPQWRALQENTKTAIDDIVKRQADMEKAQLKDWEDAGRTVEPRPTEQQS